MNEKSNLYGRDKPIHLFTQRLVAFILLLRFHTDAFLPHVRLVKYGRDRERQPNRDLRKSSYLPVYTQSTLKMSFEGGDNGPRKNNENFIRKENLRDRLPPFPEDKLVLGGDVASLFMYSFLDHIATSSFSEEETIATLIYTPKSFLVPVWSDSSLHNFGSSLIRAINTEQHMAHISSQVVETTQYHYAPCLDSVGTSAVILATCWLIAGYFNKAFSYENTMLCSPNRALMVTGRTWLCAAVMVGSLALLSDNFFCGCNKIGGLSKADIEFIFDSLSVITLWRFSVASILGGRG